jgi:3-hydroxyisobutyrate dehydrogenase
VSDLTFLGTGTMGLPMARNLITAGFDLRVWNRSPDRAAPLVEAGARRCPDPASAARGAGTLITMLSDADAVLETASQALPELAGDATWVQMSTIGIEGT